MITNWIPRRRATEFMAWFSRIEHRLVYRLSMAVWEWFGGSLDLHEAKQTRFASVHECFVRELRTGVRPIAPGSGVIVSPCDAIVGACGRIYAGKLIQAKGLSYSLADLTLDPDHGRTFDNGVYATLRLTSTMYHRFHAPTDYVIRQVLYMPGDTWNVNPATLQRVPRVFCRNERAVIAATIDGTHENLLLVPIAAILVAGIYLKFIDATFNLNSGGGRRLTCSVACGKGEELGHFEHGSTIVVLATSGMRLHPRIQPSRTIRMGQPLFTIVPD